MAQSKYDVLFEPVRIGPKTTRNRFYQTPHCTSFGVERPGAQAHFRGMKAEGGWGVVHTEYCCVHPESDDLPRIGVRLWENDDARNLRLTVDKIHEHDSLAGIELYYGGASHATINYETRMPTRNVSSIPSDGAWLSYHYAMDKEEIRELQGYYVATAERARDIGFDVINLMSAEVVTIFESFLMRYYNNRTDEYGGSLENRARFLLETLERVREAVGDDCAIVTRLCIDSRDNGADVGTRVEEAAEWISMADHLVDLWDLQAGGWATEKFAEDAGPSRYYPENLQAQFTREVRPYTKKPIVGVGRFTNPDTMVEAITNGQLDLIGAARPSIADPFLPNKIQEGRFDEVRECIGCNICASRFNQSAPIICTQNPTTGEEYRRGWHPERFTPAENAENDVLIVGAGPAGLECATVLAKRGMRRVHIVDAAPEVGGHMGWVTRLPGLGEWQRVVNYRQIQLQKLKNVEFIPKTTLDADGIREYGAEIVILANGSHWATNGISGATQAPIPGADASLPHVATPEQIMVEGKELPGERVVVYDADGYYMASCLAEKLAAEGKQVTLVTSLPALAPLTVHTMEAVENTKSLARLGVEVVAGRALIEVQPGRVVACAAADLTQEPIAELDADAVVLVTQRLAHSELYYELKNEVGRDALREDGITGLYRIGDCVAPRLIADAIFDGSRLGREIDSPDPAVPLPFIRERRVLGPGDEDHQATLQAARTRPADWKVAL